MQLNIYDFLKEKPAVGSTVYFASGNIVYKAIVVSQEAGKLSYSNNDYFQVKTKDGSTWHIVKWYSRKEDAEKEIKKYWQGKIDYK